MSPGDADARTPTGECRPSLLQLPTVLMGGLSIVAIGFEVMLDKLLSQRGIQSGVSSHKQLLKQLESETTIPLDWKTRTASVACFYAAMLTIKSECTTVKS